MEAKALIPLHSHTLSRAPFHSLTLPPSFPPSQLAFPSPFPLFLPSPPPSLPLTLPPSPLFARAEILC